MNAGPSTAKTNENTSRSLFGEAEQAFLKNDLKTAHAKCVEALQQDPNFSDGYYLLASLSLRIGNPQQAAGFAERAVMLAPQVPAFLVQWGQALLGAGDYARAASALQRAIEMEPSAPEPLKLMGDVEVKQSRPEVALGYYERALGLRKTPENYERLGLCLLMLQRSGEAESAFDEAVKLNPQFVRPLLHKASARLRDGRAEEAQALFERALHIAPNSAKALQGLGQIAERHGNNEEALRYYERSIHSAPRQKDAYLFAADLLLKMGKLHEVETCCRRVLEISPGEPLALNHLAFALKVMGRKEEALAHLQALAALKPQDESVAYMLAALKGEKADKAPAPYVANLFDGYAERFDQHLQTELGYKIPFLLAERIHALFPGKQFTSLLDLGCGTGLVAEALHKVTQRRTGVDLSEKMIEKARSKGFYDVLSVSGIEPFLDQAREKYDLVVAADVFVYIGKLEDIFKQLVTAMQPGGIFAFSVEEGGADGFQLKDSFRYGHSESYVRGLAKQHGLELVESSPQNIRFENGQPIRGQLWIFRAV